MKKFKVKDRVRIRKSSGYYYEKNFLNPINMDGTVVVVRRDRKQRYFLPIIVLWDNGGRNGYNHKDLKRGKVKEVKDV